MKILAIIFAIIILLAIVGAIAVVLVTLEIFSQEMRTLTIQIHRDELELARHALASQIRLMDSYVNKTEEQQLRLMEFQDLYFKVDKIIETNPDLR